MSELKKIGLAIEECSFTFREKKGKYVLYNDHMEPLRSFPCAHIGSKENISSIQIMTEAPEGIVRQTIAQLDSRRGDKDKTVKVTIPEKKAIPESFSEMIIEKATQILEQGIAFQFFVDTAHLIHAGDDTLLLAEWISALSSHLTNTKLNTWQIGSSGKGKSHLKYTITQLLPWDTYEIFTSASPLSLFYYVKKYGSEALDKTLLFIDEIEATKHALPMLRSLTSQTDITPRHLSVHEAELVDMKIRGSRTVWFTSVKTFGSDQIRNRFINLNPDESENQDINVFKLQDQLYREQKQVDLDKINLCKALTRVIIDETKDLKVRIPYMIDWVYLERRFLYPFFLAFIRVITKINFKQRRIKDGYIMATPEDFDTACKIWATNERTIARRVGKSSLTVFECLGEEISLAKTHSELATETGKSTTTIERLCEELLTAGLINRQKRSRERGRPAWEYWKSKVHSITDVKLITKDDVKEMLENYSIDSNKHLFPHLNNQKQHSNMHGSKRKKTSKMGKSMVKDPFSTFSPHENIILDEDKKTSGEMGINTNPLLHFSPYNTGSLNPKMCDICCSKLAEWCGTDEDGLNGVYGCSDCVGAYLQSYKSGAFND